MRFAPTSSAWPTSSTGSPSSSCWSPIASATDLSWSAPKLALIDLQYADVDPRRSLYRALLTNGKMRRLVTDDEIERARTTPPDDTRAYFRGRVMEKFGSSVVAASWDSVIFDVPDRPALQRLPLLDPLRGTREQVGQMIDECNSVTELFAALGR